MPRPLHDLKQPQAGPTAGDLGQSAYEANVRAPEPRNTPPGQKRGDRPALRTGREARD